MRAAVTAVAVIACVLVAAGCASSGTKEPTTTAVPPTPGHQARFNEDVQIALASNRRLFSIFPMVPGKERCAIPDGAIGTKAIPGTCRTSIRSRPTMEPSWSVDFTEKWLAPPCLAGYCPPPSRWRHHTWEVVEGETVVTAGSKPQVGGTRSRGATPPQYYK